MAVAVQNAVATKVHAQMLVKWAWQQHFRPPVTGKGN